MTVSRETFKRLGGFLERSVRRKSASPRPGSFWINRASAFSASSSATKSWPGPAGTISASSRDSAAHRRRASGSHSTARHPPGSAASARRHRKEVGAVLPLHLLHFDESQIRLVDEAVACERVISALAVHVASGDASQLLVDERQQGVEGIGFAPIPGQQQRRRGAEWLIDGFDSKPFGEGDAPLQCRFSP